MVRTLVESNARYRHYKNWGQGGDCVFITATCLDFAHLFARPEMRDAMTAEIWRSAEHSSVALHAYVVMSHHIHLLARLPLELTCSRWVQSLKCNSARRLLPLLNQQEESQLQAQRSLNARTFWMRSYRSVVIRGDAMFWQKVNYIHQNPVRQGLVQDPNLYEHSSAALWHEGLWTDVGGLVIPNEAF